MKLLNMSSLLCTLCMTGLQASPAQAQRRTCEPALTKFACIVVGGTRSTLGEVMKPGFRGEEGIERWRRTLYGERYRTTKEPRRARKRPDRSHNGEGARYGFYGDD